MSLHLGNLSSRVSRDELERVFRRFGRCKVQVKDKYGFVIYDYPINAERALGTLKGKRVCGEPITLSWSKKQPRPVQSYPRGGKFYEPPRKRPRIPQNLGSSGRKDNERDFKQVDDYGGRPDSVDQVDEPTSYHLNDINGSGREKGCTSADDHLNEGEGSETNPVEDERWGAEAIDPSHENGLVSGLDFDRYDPYCSDVRKEQEEDIKVTRLVVSRKSEERRVMEQVDQATLRPLRELKRLATSSHGRVHKIEAESSRSRNYQNVMKPSVSPLEMVSHRDRRKDLGEKKESRRAHERPDKYLSKKPRSPITTSKFSDCTPSRSWSGSRSHSRSKSVHSHNHFPSNSRSSSPTTLSLSVSLGQTLTSSTNKVHVNLKDSSMNVVTLETDGVLVGRERVVAGDRLLDNSRLGNTKFVVENQIASAPLEVQDDVNDKHCQNRDDLHGHFVIKSSREVRHSCTLQADIGHSAAKISVLQSSQEFQNNNLVSEIASAPTKRSELEASGRPVAANSINMSLDEICMVLKHYGLAHPQENGKNLPVETFFGSARLWPWEIIYYRRLKKGAISVKNYAQRIAQNREFGIVDKYIRSSSGWG